MVVLHALVRATAGLSGAVSFVDSEGGGEEATIVLCVFVYEPMGPFFNEGLLS
jgi:hypothetical protein